MYNTTNDITCMWYAALKGNLGVMKAMCEAETGVIPFDWDKLINKFKSDSGYAPFHLVCENGHLDCLKYLWKIEKKFSTKINTTLPIAKSGNTGLLVACSSNHPTVVKYLINEVYKDNKEFDINHRNKAGRSAIWFACWKGLFVVFFFCLFVLYTCRFVFDVVFVFV